MGIYDRDYAREDESPNLWGSHLSVTTRIIIVCVVVYIAQLMTRPPAEIDFQPTSPVMENLELQSDLFSRELLSHPWRILQLVTYGFVHDERGAGFLHIVFNMIVLWFFGREVEEHYGRKKYLAMYLTALVFAGLVWMGVDNLFEEGKGTVIGASGAIAAVAVVFAFLYPQRTVLFWGIAPVKAWVMAVIWVALDAYGAMARPPEGATVAYTAHLGGAAYGALYFYTNWSFIALFPEGGLRFLKRKPNLKIHDPESYEQTMTEKVDDILRKIQEQGQDSLTPAERRTLEEASRRYQQKHR